MTLPVTVPSGDFTPGALATLQFAAEIINTAWAEANTKHTSFETKIGAAQTELPDISTTVAGLDIASGSVADPTVSEPDTVIPEASTVYADFQSQYLEQVALLSDKFAAFRTSYFPDESTAYAAAEAALTGMLTNDSGGIPLTVQTQIIDDDRSRILADAGRASSAVLATFAARRLPMPPGAAASAVLQIEQKAQEEIAASSRRISILSIENLKFAIEKTLGLRQMAMGAALEHIKALAVGPEIASRVVGTGYDAKSKMISAFTQYFNSRISAAEIVAKVRQFNVSSALQADEKNQAADLGLIEMKIKTLLAEAQALAQMATSMYNNLHASAGTSYGVNGT